MQGIIIGNSSNLYQIIYKKNQYEASLRGKFKKEEITPVVGDKVEFEIIDKEKRKAVIEKILPRNVYIKRPKIANITQLFFVISSKDPKPDLLMLDKQLAFAEFLQIKAIIVLNKIDLDKDKILEKIKEIYQKIGYTVIETQAKNGIGIEQIKQKLKNNCNAFSGNSGVGKSTLINSIFQENRTKEGEISKKNKKGKNTTTTINLYEIEENTYLADTPGFATFSIEEIKSNQLENYFIEFKKYISNCRFVGCTHIKEENCGIKKAIQEGKINQDRYDRFCKIYQQLKEREDKRW